MNKKLLAVAVACALAAPGVALAQMTSVTISGALKVGFDNLNIGSPNAGRAGKNTSDTRVTDNSSLILLNMTEDLGGGLAAVGQVDIRFSTDIAQAGYATSPTNVGAPTMSAGGNTWVGLQSRTLGRVFFGRSDLHYHSQPDDIAVKAGALMARSDALFDFIGATAIAGATRTNNVVRYDSPNWGGFELTAAWSANPTGVETDLVSTAVTRKGQAWTVKPRYTASNWSVGWSHWAQKSDGDSTPGAASIAVVPCNPCVVAATAAATPADQRGDSLFGHMIFGGLKVGLGYNRSSLTTAANTAGTGGVRTNERNAWTVPITYTFGPNNIYFHYTRADDDKVAQAGGLNATGAKELALAYVYDFSKRTSVGLTIAQIKNNANGVYNLFTNGGGNSLGQFGSPGSTSLAGEAPRLIQATIRHAF